MDVCQKDRRTHLSLVQMYAVINGRLSLFLVWTYVGRLPDVRSANSTWTNGETPDIRYFFRNTLWIIPRHTRQVDVRYFFRELVAPLSYKYFFPPLLLHPFLELWHAPKLPELKEPYNLERIVSLKKFCEDEPFSLLGFEVTPTYPAYLAFLHFLIYVLTSFSKSLLIISLKVLMFSKWAFLVSCC